MRRLAAIAFASSLAACSLFSSRRSAEDRSDEDGAAADADAGTGAGQEARSLEEEEAILEGISDDVAEGGDPIAALIAALAAPAGEPHDVDPGAGAASAIEVGAPPSIPAYDVWTMSDDACLATLAAAGIEVSPPDFQTPFVKQPLLLDGPIDGVLIRPKSRRPIRTNEVMDCRLIVALRGVALAAREQGFKEILFYSTYRPIQEPPADCPKGAGAKKCSKARAAWDNAEAGKASMHRRALAIDVGWLTATDGAAVEVLESYELHAGEPPCTAAADTDVGRRLRDFACALHARKIFNVVLTPNANKAHHNHFHLDVTPNARWYIIR